MQAWAVGFQVFANSCFSMPSSWERTGAFWVLARIHSPHGDSNKSHPKPGQPLFHKTRDTKHGIYAFHESRMSNRCIWVLKPFSLFSVGDWFRLRVMTPLLGTKTPSAPVGAKSGGER